MVWFYERQGTFIRCETGTQPSGSGFELVVIQPDGSERVEHFDDSATLARRQAELENTLTHDGWTDLRTNDLKLSPSLQLKLPVSSWLTRKLATLNYCYNFQLSSLWWV